VGQADWQVADRPGRLAQNGDESNLSSCSLRRAKRVRSARLVQWLYECRTRRL